MKDDEKNRILAEYAGFTHHTNKDTPVQLFGHIEPTETFDFEYWLEPDGTEPIECPDLIHSLEACIEYLVPKAKPETINLIPYVDVSGWSCILIPKGWKLGGTGFTDTPYPADAFCNAILKLIEADNGE